MTRKIITGVIILVLGFFAYDFFLKPPSFKNGATAPDFSAQLTDGSDFSLSDLRGNYVLLDFWGSWCGPCIREIPDIKNMYDTYHGKQFKDGKNFHIVSIALEKSDKYTKRIIADRALNWDHHIIDSNPIIMLSSFAQLYDVKDLPSKFLINPEGDIIGNNLTVDEMRKLLDARLN